MSILASERKQIVSSMTHASESADNLAGVTRHAACLEANALEEHQTHFKIVRGYYKGVRLCHSNSSNLHCLDIQLQAGGPCCVFQCVKQEAQLPCLHAAVSCHLVMILAPIHMQPLLLPSLASHQ